MIENFYIHVSPFYARFSMPKEEFPARVVSGYRITIPPVVRKRLGIQIGDDVDIMINKKDFTSKREED